MKSPSNRPSCSKEPSLTCRSWRDVEIDSGTGVAVGWAELRRAWRAKEECTGIDHPAGWRSRSRTARRNLLGRGQTRRAKKTLRRLRLPNSKRCRRVSQSTMMSAQDYFSIGGSDIGCWAVHEGRSSVEAGCRMRGLQASRLAGVLCSNGPCRVVYPGPIGAEYDCHGQDGRGLTSSAP